MLVATLTLVALSTVFTNVYASCEYTILDVKKDPHTSVDDYKKLLKDLDVTDSFRVLGSSRLLFVVKMTEDSYSKLSRINLPGDAYSIAAGDLGEKVRLLGVNWRSWGELPDANLTLFERTLEIEEEPTEGFSSHVKAYAEKIKPALDRYPNKGFFPLGGTPPKAYVFISLPFRCEQIAEGSDFAINYLNGPGDARTKVQFVAKV